MGLAAALIPLAIHLLHRGKPRVVPFSNLAFLRELHQSRMRSVRLRQWIVLLLRMLALICLALAFARPALQQGSSLFSSSRPTTAIILLDQSWSTRFHPPGGRVFDELRQRAIDVLDALDSSRDRVFLLPWPMSRTAASGRAMDSDLDSDLDSETARLILEDLVPADAAGGLQAALRRAHPWLTGAEDRQRELYLVTDLARPDWIGPDWDGQQVAPELPVYVLSTADSERHNQFVGPVHIEDWLAARGQKLSIRAMVGRWGGPESVPPTTVHLYLDGERVQQRRIDLPRGSSVAVEFSVAPRRGGSLTGFIEMEDGGLAVDNRRYFTLDVPAKISVLIAGGRATDAYYPRHALHAAASGDPTLAVTSVSLNELSAAHLQDTDVLVLTNIETVAPPLTGLVRDFASSGGGVLIIPGTKADAAKLNRELLADLIPASLADVSGTPGGKGAAYLDTTRLSSALFSGLLHDNNDRPQFHATFEVTAQQQLAVLARFDDGLPAMIEGRGPAGHALLWPTPLHLAWSDLPLRGLFVPLLQRMVRYLARSTAPGRDYIVGERAWRRLPGVDNQTRVEAESPSGRRSVVQPERVGDEHLWKVPLLSEAGIWRLRVDGAVADIFAVNVDIREADLTPVSQDIIRTRLGAHARLLEPGTTAKETIFDARFGRELWREFLVLAVLLLLTELWVARAPAAAPTASAATRR